MLYAFSIPGVFVSFGIRHLTKCGWVLFKLVISFPRFSYGMDTPVAHYMPKYIHFLFLSLAKHLQTITQYLMQLGMCVSVALAFSSLKHLL